MARVLDRDSIILELKAGREIIGTPIQGYSMRGGKYDGWTVRADTVSKWLKQGLLSKTPDEVSYYFHYKWTGGL